MIRVSGLAAVVSLQVYMLQRFLTFHMSRRREAARLAAAAEAEAKKAKQDKKAKKAREAAKKTSEEEISELPEVDQNTNKNLRQRGAAKAKWSVDLELLRDENKLKVLSATNEKKKILFWKKKRIINKQKKKKTYEARNGWGELKYHFSYIDTDFKSYYKVKKDSSCLFCFRVQTLCVCLCADESLIESTK